MQTIEIPKELRELRERISKDLEKLDSIFVDNSPFTCDGQRPKTFEIVA